MSRGSGYDERRCIATRCPQCGANVYLIRPERGGTFWVDEVGEPWIKHGCFDDEERPSPGIRPVIAFEDLVNGRITREVTTPGGMAPSVVGLPGPGSITRELDIRNRDLSGLSLEGAVFLSCDFRDADLSASCLDKTTLLDCDFRGANLDRCSLQYADVRRSDFTHATFHGARIIHIQAAGAIGLEQWTSHPAALHPAQRSKRGRRR